MIEIGAHSPWGQNTTALRILFTLLGFVFLAGCDRSDAKRREMQPARPVLATTVHYAPRIEPRVFVAVIRPRTETDQGFRVGGKVAERFAEIGWHVSKGDPLARLDDSDLRLQVEQAEAEVMAAKTALEYAMAEEARGSRLREHDSIAPAAYDRLKSASEEARGRYSRGERALELARNSLDYATLRAEAEGVVTATSVEPGQVVVPGQPAIRVARLGEKEALAAAPEQYLGLFRQGKADLVSWSAPDKHFIARLRELSPVPDPVARTYAARFSLPTADESIALGMSAILTLFDPNSQPVACLPLTALLNEGHGPAIFVIDADGRLTLTPVTIESYDGASVYIIGGVREGTRVVALGVQKLDDGQIVRILSDLGL